MTKREFPIRDISSRLIRGTIPTPMLQHPTFPKGSGLDLQEKRDLTTRNGKNFEMGRGSLLNYQEKFQVSEKSSYGANKYKGKNPMSRIQWRRFQRKKKDKREAAKSSNNKPYQN